MISTSVKDVSAGIQLFDLNKAGAAKKNQTGNDLFQDVLNKESGQNAPYDGKQEVKNIQKSKPDTHQDLGRKQSVRADKVKNASEAEQGQELSEDDLTRAQEVLNSEVNKILQNVAETFGVSEEELSGMMEELGLEAVDLLETDELGALLLKAAGEADSFSLITNEVLYGEFQDMMKLRQDVCDEIQTEIGISPKELLDTMEQSKEHGETQTNGVTSQDILIVNENLNDKTPVKVNVNQENSKESKNEKSDVKQELQGLGFSENLKQTESMTEISETTETSGSSATDAQNIMRQIMDFMKVSLRPESNQLVMQLHPASLGSLQIQLASKGGAVTAQFIAQNENVKAVLESQMIALKENFEQQGLKVEAIEVTVQTHQFEENMNQSREQAGETQAKRTKTRRIRLDGIEGEELLEEASDEIRLAQEMLKANGNQVDYTA